MPDALNLFVGAVATAVSLGAGAAALNVWSWPYSLAAASRIERNWGRSVARFYFGLLAILLGFAAVCIFGGMRPRFAASVQRVPIKHATV